MFVRQAMSKRILGVGIILGGLIVLTIALIIGIGFPEFVYETNLKAVCIQDASHPRYKLWVCCAMSIFNVEFHQVRLIYDWIINNLVLSRSKTKEVIFYDSRRRKNRTTPHPLADITREHSLKILGVTLTFSGPEVFVRLALR